MLNYNNMPLYSVLKNIPEFTRLHTPGHKGNAKIFNDFEKMDFTELSITDNLYNPVSLIEEAEKKATLFYKTKQTVFSSGGATLCIQTALSFFNKKKILMDRNSHLSAINACALLDISPVFVYNKFNVDFGVPLPICSEEIEKILNENKDISAVYLTNPNYYGLYSNIKRIKDICINFNVPLIVDNAHGSHLFVTDKENAPHNNADIIIDSAHKTLPVLTGGALLHFNLDIPKDKIKKHMSLFGSTSPSFPILASLDYARAWLENEGENEFSKTINCLFDLKKGLTGIEVEILNNKYKDDTVVFCDDTRLTINCCNLGYTGFDLQNKMEQYSIYPEMADNNNVVMLFSPFNSDNDYKKILDFFTKLEKRNMISKRILPSYPKTQRKISLKEAFYAENKKVLLTKAVGQVSAENIVPYPPGVPIVICGELITEEIIELLENINYKDEISVIK